MFATWKLGESSIESKMSNLNATLEEIRSVRFGVFEADLQARELRKRGLRVKLQAKPFLLLEMLLARPGEVVTRKELRERLWPDTFVGFDRSLNTAVNSLRAALGDSALNPRFIETRARLGYRFIAPVEASQNGGGPKPRPAYGGDSIAVLPFRNLTGDPDTEYLSDGITEAVINNLSQVQEIRVLARSTMFRFKGRENDPQLVGRELAARTVLTGEVASYGNGLCMSAELVEVETGWRLWGRQYRRQFADLLAVEEEVSREITETLRLRLSRQEEGRLARRPTSNAAAYQDYLKGRFYWNRMTEESVKKALSFFERAIEKDHAFALAYTGLADAYSLLAFFDLVPPREVMPKAREAVLRALEIDSGLAEAHVSLAGITKVYDWDWKGAEREYVRALELNPHSADAHRLYASLMSALGRPAEAGRENQKAQELDPLSLVISMEGAWHYYMAREYTRAVHQVLETLEMEPNFPPAHFVLALAYEQIGRYDVALAAFEKVRFFAGNNSTALAGLGHVFSSAGQKSKAMGALKVLEELSKRRYVAPYSLALVYSGLGMTDEAFEWLGKSLEFRDAWLIWLNRDPRLDRLRADPRFSAILQRLGFLPAASRVA